jgi:hypothetical protein
LVADARPGVQKGRAANVVLVLAVGLFVEGVPLGERTASSGASVAL